MQWHYSERVAIDDKMIDYLKRRLDDIERQAAPAKIASDGKPTQISPHPPPIRPSDQSNSQLRRGAEAFASQLRQYEAAYQMNENQQWMVEWAERSRISKDDKDAMNKKWNEDMLRDEKRRSAHRADFDTRFRGPLLAYREEICKRVQFTSPCPDNTTSKSLDSGLLAGPSPIQEFANYLEVISRLLPSD